MTVSEGLNAASGVATTLIRHRDPGYRLLIRGID